MTDIDQLDENLRCMSGKYSESDAHLLASYNDAIRPVLCRMCGACDGRCPNGTPVSDVVRSIMYAEGYGEFGLGLATFESSEANRRCAECPGCTVGCPNGVDVPERIKRARKLFC